MHPRRRSVIPGRWAWASFFCLAFIALLLVCSPFHPSKSGDTVESAANRPHASVRRSPLTSTSLRSLGGGGALEMASPTATVVRGFSRQGEDFRVSWGRGDVILDAK